MAREDIGPVFSSKKYLGWKLVDPAERGHEAIRLFWGATEQ
ncbi:hypothetical protein [Streptomyces sp. NPDC017529]